MTEVYATSNELKLLANTMNYEIMVVNHKLDALTNAKPVDPNVKLLSESRLVITGTTIATRGVAASGITKYVYKHPNGTKIVVEVDTNKYEEDEGA